MSKICEISGKRPMSGNNVSHANNRTKRRFIPNLQNVNVHKESLGVVAAFKFGGWATEKRSKKFINILMQKLGENNIEIVGDIRVAQYDGPTTIPPFRKNEILIPVKMN